MCSAFDYDTENMNSEDIYSSLRGVTEAIQNFSVRSQEDMNEPVRRREGEEVGSVCVCVCGTDVMGCILERIIYSQVNSGGLSFHTQCS